MKPKITVIPPTRTPAPVEHLQPRLRVAAYCRVSTDDEEQLTSYEAQKVYYTDKIMSNLRWTLEGIYADEGITGTSARKRPEFLRMIRHCRQKKIDLILTKSISRFSRNTVDCLNYIRMLKTMGISIFFEKENINTLESDSELLITLLGAFAQAESESISANVRWGKRRAMQEGRVSIQYSHLYAFRKGADGKPEIIPEEAVVVRRIFHRFLSGDSFRMIQQDLEENHIKSVYGRENWSISAIRSILLNEKYCGDVLLQKTFTENCISRKVVKNTGQLPMYLIRNHHPGIISRPLFDAAQAELVRRNSRRSPSKKYAPTGRGSYSGKYALSERLVCGECGTLYQRCTWVRGQAKRIVWRCVSRVEFGARYCHHSPTLDEGPLQTAILTAIASAFPAQALSSDAPPLPAPTGNSRAALTNRMVEISQETHRIIVQAAAEQNSGAYAERLKALTEEAALLKQQLAEPDGQTDLTPQEPRNGTLPPWSEALIRRTVERVTVISAQKISVRLKNGVVLEEMLPTL